FRGPPTNPRMGSRDEREQIAPHLLTDHRSWAGFHARIAGRWHQSVHGRLGTHSRPQRTTRRQMTKEPLVQVIDLDFAYRDGEGWSRVLHGVNFTIFHGEAFGLGGESGCGKSTIAYQLLAYRRENSRIECGHILFAGMDLNNLDRRALDRLRGNRVALVPQNPTTALSPGMRVGRQLVEVLQFHDMFKGREAERTETLFRLVGLPDPAAIGRRYPHQLSGGQQQRVCIAMA